MRAYELYEENYMRWRERSDRITLRDLRRIKIKKRAREAQLAQRVELAKRIYGDQEIRQQEQALAMEKERLELELQQQRLEIEKLIADAEIDKEQRDHIQQMALKTIHRK